MRSKKLAYLVAAASLVATFAGPAKASVVDAWQMTINGDTYTNIGRLSLTAGSATVYQEVNALGDVFTGALFSETSTIYSISYVQNTVVGPLDSGSPVLFNGNDQLRILLTGITGHVTGPSSGGGFAFAFDSGSYVVQNNVSPSYTQFANGSLVGIGGTLNNTTGFSGANGQSIQDLAIAAVMNGFAIKDSSGTPFDLSKVMFEAVTNNQVGGVSGPVTCPFTPSASGNDCLQLGINSNGDAYLTTVPEPATVALVGVGLLGLGLARRRKRTA